MVLRPGDWKWRAVLLSTFVAGFLSAGAWVFFNPDVERIRIVDFAGNVVYGSRDLDPPTPTQRVLLDAFVPPLPAAGVTCLAVLALLRPVS